MKYFCSLIVFIFLFNNLEAQEDFINYHDNGEASEVGKLLNGKRDGKYFSYHKNKEAKVVATYINGFIIEKKMYDYNGNITTSMYMINGSDDFQVYKFDSKGKISEEGIIDSKGLKNGEWIYYNSNSRKSKTIIYKDDKAVISH